MKCYKLYDTKKNWDSAKESCEDGGGELAIIPNEDTQTFIESLPSEVGGWIGLHQESQSREWFWTDGSPLEYKNWAVGQPDETIGHIRAFIIGKWGDTGKWGGTVKNQVKYYYCQFPTDTTTTVSVFNISV